MFAWLLFQQNLAMGGGSVAAVVQTPVRVLVTNRTRSAVVVSRTRDATVTNRTRSGMASARG